MGNQGVIPATDGILPGRPGEGVLNFKQRFLKARGVRLYVARPSGAGRFQFNALKYRTELQVTPPPQVTGERRLDPHLLKAIPVVLDRIPDIARKFIIDVIIIDRLVAHAKKVIDEIRHFQVSVEFDVPSLQYWDLVLLQRAEKTDAGTE